ncbi:MAG: transcription-repair coupling factor [Bdellovibrionales bacterium]
MANIKVDNPHLRLDEIVERLLGARDRNVTLTGFSSGLPLAFLLSTTHSVATSFLPHLVICPSERVAQDFQALLKFFNPSCSSFLLRAFDVSPYSGLTPQRSMASSRLEFLYAAANRAKPGTIFISTQMALVQKTLPFFVFNQLSWSLKKGAQLSSNLGEKLVEMGYRAAPVVEDYGQFALRGGILDLFSPSERQPLRVELFGDEVDSLRFFDPETQRGLEEISSAEIVPAKEALYVESEYEGLIQRVRRDFEKRSVRGPEADSLLRSLVLKNEIEGQEFLISSFYSKPSQPLDYFNCGYHTWKVDSLGIQREFDQWLQDLREGSAEKKHHPICPQPEDLFLEPSFLLKSGEGKQISLTSIEEFGSQAGQALANYTCQTPIEISRISQSDAFGSPAWFFKIKARFKSYLDSGKRIWITHKNSTSLQKVQWALKEMEFDFLTANEQDFKWDVWLHSAYDKIVLIPRGLDESLFLDEEGLLILQEEDLLGKRQRKKSSAVSDFQKQAKRLNFGDLKPGDFIVHVKHGIGVYDGLQVMNVGGAPSEFIQISYKDKDKLYLPVYRINQLQKYSSSTVQVPLDKLGGHAWEKTKTKVRGHLRDLAADLLKLYAQRSELHREAFVWDEGDLLQFERGFPYEETDDQLRAIDDIFKDLHSTKPMDRLICGDVGFGKTEVAMRAAFAALASGKQVAVLAPTTVLTFQHFETFKKRFQGWPFEIRVLNRFVSTADSKKIVKEVKEGTAKLLIGTHRILSQDIHFNNLGLLIVDEEQKFGVAHKEKLKKLKVSVDTLALSATPIPRTLNMSLNGVRDLSLINSAPVDRLPTRTFICKFEAETFRKAILAEMQRNGQIYFINNRIESIYGLADELRALVPEARIRVAHGQMPEHELEKVMLEFFNHEIDMLICTAIVESGMDVPRANTMFINEAHLFGLSQLYQLRGRVGRSKQRAYCYLVMPRTKALDKTAEERLKVIQENTALGSGIKIAQYDLEMRGSGNILGDDQSGHINSVGYELYMDLLKEALAAAHGEEPDDIELDPEISLKIPALIPDQYIPDIRLRLSYYKAMSDIESEAELENIESELIDQFGALPESVTNLMGLMLIRHVCKKLKVRDVSAGVKSISLIFTDKTPLKTETLITLASKENKKYSITPDSRLNIRMNNVTWTQVYDELNYLLRLI